MKAMHPADKVLFVVLVTFIVFANVAVIACEAGYGEFDRCVENRNNP